MKNISQEIKDRIIAYNSGRAVKITPHTTKQNAPADNPLIYSVFTANNEFLGVIHLSPDKFPARLECDYQKTIDFHKSLGRRSLVQLPEFCGWSNGLSYTFTHGLYPLRSNISWAIQKRYIAPYILRWIAEHSPVQLSEVVTLKNNLTELYQEQALQRQIRENIENALNALYVGDWKPILVPSHNDFWKGNIMLPTDKLLSREFRLIDCGASSIDGYGLQDFVSLGRSFAISSRAISKALGYFASNCSLSKEQLMFQYLAGMAHLYKNLGEFPLERFHQKLNREVSYVGPALLNLNESIDIKNTQR
ncbi:MAG: hypothetical protein JJU48_02845 [Methylophaga sp.]|nr:hypothetical protein [Methylophaga sp.]